MARLNLTNINKIYPNGVHAVIDFNLEINDRDFVVLVGPSGCGKSTLLRMIAGLESITTGDMILDGLRINDKAPADRNIAMIFQDYALYGNMTVYQNMGFSLIVRKKDSNTVFDAIMKTADTVKLVPQLNRYPRQLSGGQRQRVALGRSIVRDARVFLMDEPLSNLDAKLRNQTRKELVKLHNQIAATIVYVTHDQIEAMTMANKMVVMNEGKIQQAGAPYYVYHEPANLYVATFIGTPAMNVIKGNIQRGMFISNNLTFKLPANRINLRQNYEGKPVILGIRPEMFNVSKTLDDNVLNVQVTLVELLGSTTHVRFMLNDTTIIASVASHHDISTGEQLSLVINTETVHFFDVDTEHRIAEEDNHHGYK